MFTGYTILCHYLGLEVLAETTRTVAALSNVHADLTQLLQIVQLLLQQWTDYSDILDSHRTLSSYTPPFEQSTGGRPKFHISREQLHHLRSLSFTWTDIADMLKVSRMTIYRRRVEYDMLDESDSMISDQELNEKVQQIMAQHPQVGQTFVSGRLRSLGYRVARERVRCAVRSVDPLSSALRWQGFTARRRPYSVPGPNSLWHIGNFLSIAVYNSICCKKRTSNGPPLFRVPLLEAGGYINTGLFIVGHHGFI